MDDTVGKAEIYLPYQTAFRDRLHNSSFTEDWLIEKITKETHPEYFL
jgi:hypothetical protein